jgi:class 3 adenylate cyclase
VRNSAYSILIVDDIENTAEGLRVFLQNHEPTWVIATAVRDDAHVEEVIERVKQKAETGNPFAVVICDLRTDKDNNEGIKVIKAVQACDPLAMTILYTAHPPLLPKQSTSSLGAFDVLFKSEEDSPSFHERVLERTRTAIRYREWAERISFLRRYFDKRLFEKIENDPAILEPRSRDVTVVFWDIRGFSALCEQLREDPGLIAGFLKEYCDLAAKIIFDHSGLLDKFMGDGVMALFGVLDQNEEAQRKAALDAVGAASMLKVQFDAILPGWVDKWRMRAKEHLAELRLGCGIHTGRAVVGNLGTEFRDQFTAVGPNVNFAQRLESLAARESGADILISQTTAAHIERVIKVQPFRVVNDVKNIPGNHQVNAVNPDDALRHFAIRSHATVGGF